MLYKSHLYFTTSLYANDGVYKKVDPLHPADYIRIGNDLYKTIVLGNRIWMAENLRYKTTNSVGRDDDSKYGQYYGLDDISELQSIIPNSWRIPDINMEDVATLYSPSVEALQSTEFLDQWPNATDSTGFSAVPGGTYRISDRTFPSVNEGKFILLTNDLSRTFILQSSFRTIYGFGDSAQYYRFNIRLCKDL